MNNTNNSNYYHDKVYQLLTKVAKTEPTVELELYWQKRYQEIFDNSSFNLSEHTLDMVFENLVTRPSTPSGLINIEQILDDKTQIKETALQNIVETAVRLLDAILDIINFDESANNTVKEFRKIAIGIENLESYLTIPEMLVDQVDYLGEIISNSVYRASESLAEEKGACLRWEDIKNDISSKTFEYWFNPDSGEIRTSLEIEEFVTNNPDSYGKIISEFEIVARRGSHLLLYPDKPEWTKWSDRKQLQPKTKSKNPAQPEPEIELELEEPQITVSDVIEDLPEFLKKAATTDIKNPIVEEPAIFNNEINEINNETNNNETNEINQEVDSLNEYISKSSQETSLPTSKISKEHNKNFAFPEMISMEDVLPGLIGETQNWTEGEDDFSSIFGLGKFNNKPSKSNNAKAQIETIEEGRVEPIKVEMVKEEYTPPKEVLETLEPEEIAMAFGVGELVKVLADNNISDFYQIVDITTDGSEPLYHLTDRDDAQVVKVCSADEIQPALLEELILSANIGSRIKLDEEKTPEEPEVISPSIEYYTQAIVFNQNGQVLLNNDRLPQVQVPQDSVNIDCLTSFLNSEHNIIIKDIEEIGTFAINGSVQTVFLGQLDDEINQTKALGLTIVDIDKALDLVPNLEKYLSKASEKEMQAKKRYATLNNEFKAAVEENQNLKQKIRLLGLNLQVLADENLPKPSKSNNIQKAINTRGEYNYIHITEHSKFSKFFPTLEQVITDDEIGKITLKIQYDTFGAKKASIEIDSDKLRDKDRTLLTSYLNLVNTSLASGASLADVSYVLEHQGKGKLDFGNNLINKILLILSLCFLAMPASIEQVNASDMIIVTLAKVLESINQNKSLLELVLESEPNKSSIAQNNEKTGEKQVTKHSNLTKKVKA